MKEENRTDERKKMAIAKIKKERKDNLFILLIFFIVSALFFNFSIHLFKDKEGLLMGICLIIAIGSLIISFHIIGSIKQTFYDMNIANINVEQYEKLISTRKSKLNQEQYERERKEYEFFNLSGKTCPHCNYKNPKNIDVSNYKNAKIRIIKDDNKECFYCSVCYNRFEK